MKRRYLIIFVIVLLIIIIAGVLYRRKTATPSAPTGISTTTGGTLPSVYIPTVQNGGVSGQNGASSVGITNLTTPGTQFGLVADAPVLNYFIDTNNNVFAAEPNGEIIQISNNTVSVISSSTIPYLKKVSFSYDERWMLREYGAGNTGTFSLFDIQNKKELLIPGVIESPTWAPNSDSLMFFADNGATRSLATLNVNDKSPKAKLLMNLSMQDVILSWVRPDGVLLTEHPSVEAQGSVYLLTISTKTLKPIVSEQYGASALWDPASNFGLVFESTTRGKGGVLYLAGESGAGLIPLSFLTFPSKCTFSTPPYLFNTSSSSTKTSTASSTNQAPSLTSPLYCLIPADRSQLDNSPLPDLYEQKGVYTSDNAYRVDLSTGDTTLLYTATIPLDATQVKTAGNRLFFINRLDNRLYALSL